MQPHRHPFPRRILSALAIALSPSLLAAQLDDARAPGQEALPATAVGSVVASSHGVVRSGTGWTGGGERYQACFSPGGVSFLPALGEAAPHDLPLQLTLRAIERGGAVLVGEEATPPMRAGAAERVTYRRGAGVEERWDVTPAGVELSYRFASRPAGSGDLVVRLDVETELVPAGRPDARGLLFHRPGVGGVHVGGVTGVDATGATTTGELRLQEGELALVLPAAFVDAATYPLVLDPLIGTSIDVSNSAFDDGDPDVAYEGTTGNYLVVWERRFSQSSASVRGQRVAANGALLGGTIFLTPGAGEIAVDPRVAAIGGQLSWMVVYQYAPNFLGTPNVVAVPVQADSSFGAQVSVSPSANVQTDPVIGGTMHFSALDALVAWEEAGVGIRATRVTHDGQPAGSPFTLDSIVVGRSPANPAISRSYGEGRTWLLAWERIDLAGDGEVWARGVTSTGRLVGSGATLVSSTKNATDASHPSVDGDGTHFVVAWEKEEANGTDRDVVAAAVQLTLGSLEFEATERIVEGDQGDDEFFPAVAWTGGNAVVAFIDEDVSGPNAYMDTIDPLGCQPCEDDYALESSSVLDTRTMRAAAAYHGGDPTAPNDDVFVLYERHDTALGHSHAVGQLYDPPKDGNDLGGGTPAGGLHTNPCLLEGNVDFRAHLQGGPPSTLTFFVVSEGQLGLGCGSGAVFPALDGTHAIYPSLTDAGGDAEQAIAVPPGVAGAQVYSQWVTPVAGGGCPLASGFELSNARFTTVQ